MRYGQMESYLFIIITRMYAQKGSNNDEFVVDWGQLESMDEVFLKGNTLDLLLIHGYNQRFKGTDERIRSLANEAVHSAIVKCSIDVQLYNEIYMFYHYDSELLKKEHFHQLSLKEVKAYGIGRKSGENVLIENIKSLNLPQNVQEEAKSVFPRIRVTMFSRLIHSIAHLFLPIDIDLQGLIETGFKEKYWKEVAQTWAPEQQDQETKAYKVLEKAKTLIYGDPRQTDYVEKIVNHSKRNADEYKKEQIDKAWQEIVKLLPKDGNPNNEAVVEILKNLGIDLESVKNICKNGRNPFRQWFADLDKAFEELRNAIEPSIKIDSR